MVNSISLLKTDFSRFELFDHSCLEELPSHPKANELPEGCVTARGGIPTLAVGGKAINGYMYNGPHDPEQLKRIGRAGIRIFLMSFNLPSDSETPEDFAYVDRHVHSLLHVVPDAFIIFRTFLSPTEKFAREHPGECMAWEGGEYAPYDCDRYLDRNFGKYSFASNEWRRQAGVALETFARRVMDADYRKNIAGFFPTAGGTGEWYNWHRPGRDIDFSPAMQQTFGSWVRSKYRGNVDLLREAWKDPEITFENVQVPDSTRRASGRFGDYLDPATNQRTIDYLNCHSDCVQDKVIYMSRVIKKVSGGRSLFGTFLGYLQCMDHELGGHSSFRELLEAPTIDFWVSPPTYVDRGPGGHASYRFPLQSLRRHNKVWLSEEDFRTHRTVEDGIRSTLGAPENERESCEVLKRCFCQTLCEGTGAYWFEMGKSTFNDPALLATMSDFQQIAEAAAEIDKRSAAQIAVVVHQESLWCSPTEITATLIDWMRMLELCRVGAPYDYWELGDLFNSDEETLKRYRMVIFLNAFDLDDKERKTVEDRLKKDGRMLVWFAASGLIKRRTCAAVENMRELTGFVTEFLPAEASQEILVEPNNSLGIPDSFSLGRFSRPIINPWVDEFSPVECEPKQTRGVFVLDDSEAEILGRYQENSLPGFGLKKFSSWTSVYVGSLCAPANVLRSLASRAGCHIYSDSEDVLYANRSFLCIHTNKTGRKKIRLPESTGVFDVFSEKEIACSTNEFEIDIKEKYTTKLYLIGHAAGFKENLAYARQRLNERRNALKQREKTQNTFSARWWFGEYEK